MSFATEFASISQSRLIVPYPSRMHRSNISRNDQALCFVLDKGYFETVLLGDMLNILDNIQSDTIVYVGNVEKIRQWNNSIVYRQRIVFRNLKIMLNLCRSSGVYFNLGLDFHVTIDSLQDFFSEFKSMKYYAGRFNEPIDVWLTNCCIIHIHELLKMMNLHTDYGNKVDKILYKRIGYFDRAPFLLASYDKREKKSSVFIEMDTNDSRLYSTKIIDKSHLSYGYTVSNIKNDRKAGLF